MNSKNIIDREIDKLLNKILFLGGRVEENFNNAVKALENRDRALAQSVIDSDEEIDELEVELEEECLKVLALHQPVATDLRFIVTVLKVNNDLERIDDLSGNMAKHGLFFVDQPLFTYPFDFSQMVILTRSMLKHALDALVDLDQDKAISVKQMDDQVDDINRAMYKEAERRIQADPSKAALINHTMSVSRCFERISDLACNIAEDVVYLISGQIFRH